MTAVRFDFSGCGKSQGHSQGGVVAGMLAGLYPDIVKKLILLPPAATLKTDAQKGVCMGTFYDTEQVPEVVLVDDSILSADIISALQKLFRFTR